MKGKPENFEHDLFLPALEKPHVSNCFNKSNLLAYSSFRNFLKM